MRTFCPPNSSLAAIRDASSWHIHPLGTVSLFVGVGVLEVPLPISDATAHTWTSTTRSACGSLLGLVVIKTPSLIHTFAHLRSKASSHLAHEQDVCIRTDSRSLQSIVTKHDGQIILKSGGITCRLVVIVHAFKGVNCEERRHMKAQR